MSWTMFFTLRIIPWKFHVDIIIISVSGRDCPEWGDLEDAEGEEHSNALPFYLINNAEYLKSNTYFKQLSDTPSKPKKH